MKKIIALLLTLLMLLPMTVNAVPNTTDDSRAADNNDDKQLIVAYMNAQAGIASYEFENIDVINYHPATIAKSVYDNPKSGEIIHHGAIGLLKILKSIATDQNPDIKFLLTVATNNLAAFESWFYTKANAQRLADEMILIIRENGFDGLDIDYEFPSANGPEYIKDNYVYFMSLMREKLDLLAKDTGEEYILSMAVPCTKWAFDLFKLNELAEYVDYFNIMNYDGYINASVTHHHAPAYDNDPVTGLLGGSVYSDIKLYLERGIPADKIVAGCGLYALRWNGVADINNGLYQGAKRDSSNLHYTDLLANYIDKNGYVRYWDEEACAPYLYNAEEGVFISYDDEDSVKEKCRIVADSGVRGIMVFDYCTTDGIGLFDNMRLWLDTFNSEKLPFKDVKFGSWYYDAVKECYINSLMKGTGEDTFAPSQKVTREQFVQALANIEGVDLTEYEEQAKVTPFSDVPSGKWYSCAIEWARTNKIVEGVSAKKFGLGIKVSREQMATMLARYAAFKGQMTDYSADLDIFADKDKISNWAIEGVSYSVALGIFKGNEKSCFNPLGEAQRSELATVLMRINKISSSRILCWGDSLTMGIETGWENIVDVPYPERLSEYLGVETVNYGIGSEHSDMIAMRQGALPFYTNWVTIPAECEPVEVSFSNLDSNEVLEFPLYGFEGLNDVEIAGVRGKLSFIDGHRESPVVFTRNEPGEEVVIKEEKVRVETEGMRNRKEDDILIIWSGSNDLHDVSDLDVVPFIIENQQKMVDYAGTDEFIIVGYTANNYLGNDSFRDCADRANDMLRDYWGDKFLDIKEYMATEQVLSDYGIEPTEKDREFLAKGWIPASLLENSENYIHFNQQGYDIVAEMIAEKIVECNYLG